MRIVETRTVLEYFKDALEEAAAELQVEISQLAQFYLVDLLSRYTQAQTLNEPAWGSRDKAFGQVFLESTGFGSEKRARILRQIGDTTLFLSGFFSDSFQRQLVDLDYYTTLGRAAYAHLDRILAAHLVDWGFEDVFNELSTKFLRVVDIFAEISESGGRRDPSSLLRVYERWIRTHSPRDAEILRRRGIFAVDDSTPDRLQ